MQPERIAAVTFFDAGGRAAIAAVTRRAAKLLRIVDLQQLFTGVTDERCCQFVGYLAGATRGHVRSFDYERFTRAKVTNLAAINDPEIVHVNLMAEDCVIERLLVLPDQIVKAF